MRATDVDFKRMLEGYGVTTAEVLYKRPDSPALIMCTQTFSWQFMDLAPEFPRLTGFLDWWRIENAAAPILLVRYAHERMLTPREVVFATEVEPN